MDFLKIVRAEYLEGYCLKLWFNNGEVRVADLSQSLVGPMFEPLKEIGYFMNYKIPHNTVEWENGADFAPEYLYEISIPKTK